MSEPSTTRTDPDAPPPDLRPEPSLAGLPGPALPAAPPVPYGAPVPPAPRPSALPLEPSEYHRLLRGPRFRWWQPVVATVLAGLMIVAAAIAALPLTALVGLAFGVRDVLAAVSELGDLGPLGFFYLNLSIIGFIPASLLATWAVFGVRPRFTSSVAGGLRWRWLARCALVLVPVWVLYLGFEALVSRPASPRPEEWVVLLLLVVVMTPLQAAAEEYFVRGFLTQATGAWFASPRVGLVVSTVVSATVFALLHGSFDPWIFATLVVFGVTASMMTWRTGGLEAAIAMHAVNNLGAFGLVLSRGGWDEAFISQGSTGTPAALVVALVVHGLALALVLWQARRAGVDRWFRPAAPPPPG